MDEAVTIAPLSLRDLDEFALVHARFDPGDARAFLLQPHFRLQARDPQTRQMVGYGWLDDEAACVRGVGGAVLTDRLLVEAVLRGRRSVRVGDREVALPTDPASRAALIRKRLEGARVSIVPYSHADWAWVHTRHWHERRYALVFCEVLDRLQADPSFRWYFDNAACQFSAFAAHHPERIPELRQRIAAGQIAVCGGYSNVRPHMVGDETFVRNLVLGRRFWADLFPEADLSVHGDAVDVATGHSQLPQLLTQAGYRYLRIWRPYGQMSLKGIPNEFVWRGADGSEILTSRGLYGGQWYVTDACQAAATPRDGDWDAVLTAFWDLDIEERSRYSVAPHLWVAHGADDARPGRMLDDRPFDIDGLIARWNENESAPMRFATPVEQFADLEAMRVQLPTVAGPLDTCDVAYNAAWNGEKGLGVDRVANDRALCVAETLCALASLAGLPVPEGALTALWKDHLLTCAHATQWLYRDDFAHIRRIADRVRADADALADAALDRLIQAADPPADATRMVYNPLPFARLVEVVVPVAKFADTWPLALADADGNRLPGQVIDASSGQGGFPEVAVLTQVEVPPLGFAVLREVPDSTGYAPAPIPDTPTMDNGCCTLRFDDAHRLVEIVDRTAGRTLTGDETEWCALVLSHVAVTQGPLHVGPITAETACVWDSLAIVEHGPIRWRCVRTGRLGEIPVSLTVTLLADEPQADFALEVDWPGVDGFLAARVPLPDAAVLRADVPFGVEGRDPDGEPYGCDHRVSPHSMERTRPGLFYARSFVACDPPGVALVSGNTDRYYRKPPGAPFLEHLLINSVVTQDAWEGQVEQSTLTGRGVHHLRWSLVFPCTDVPLVRRAASVRQPAIGRPVRRAAPGGVPRVVPEIGLSPENVQLSALYREGRHWVVRLHETAGRAATASLRLPVPVAGATPTDLMGTPRDGVAVVGADGALSVALAPWEIRTLRIPAPR